MKCWRQALEDFERSYWEAVFSMAGSVTEAARIAGINRGTYYTHRRKFNLRPLKSPRRGGNAAWKALSS